jgi:hypothetical protein
MSILFDMLIFVVDSLYVNFFFPISDSYRF